jgi:hypothetical protein
MSFWTRMHCTLKRPKNCFRTGISDFILKSKKELDLDVHWYLPWIVKAERKYQMAEKAYRYLPQLEKLEKLLGHQLGITSDTLSARVDEAIKKNIDRHGMKEVGLTPSLVDWQRMIERSVSRQAPFERGENEKGFRDAILLEIFCQLINTLPKSPQTCRIVLLTNDGLLATAARERVLDRNNIILIADLESLKTMLNALAAELTQETVASLLPKASELFFEKDNNDSLYFKMDVWKKTLEKFRDMIYQPPAPEFSVTLDGILIHSTPTFLSKTGQTLQFADQFTLKMAATKRVPKPSLAVPWNRLAPQPLQMAPSYTLPSSPDNTFVLQPSPFRTSNPFEGIISGAIAPQEFDEVKREGEHVFRVTWTVTLKANGTLVGAKLQGIDHVSSSSKE